MKNIITDTNTCIYICDDIVKRTNVSALGYNICQLHHNYLTNYLIPSYIGMKIYVNINKIRMYWFP